MLPIASEEQLMDELAEVVTAGWRTRDRPQLREKIRYLLAMADQRPHELFGDTARRLLDMIDRSFKDNASEPLDITDEPLLTQDQCHGLRVLFGVDPATRLLYANDRRHEAAPLLLGRDEPIRGDTFRRKHEADAIRLALECLRASYGQAEVVPTREYRAIERASYAEVHDGHITSLKSAYVYRSKIDGLSSVRSLFYLQDIHDRLEVGDVEGVEYPNISEVKPGVLRLTFPLVVPLEIGDDLSWSYRRNYIRSGSPVILPENRVSIISQDNDFRVNVEVKFHAPWPSTIWRFAESKLRHPGEPSPDLLMTPDNAGIVAIPETTDTNSNLAYGIAWRMD